MKKEQKTVLLTVIRGQVNCSMSETLHLQVFFSNEHRHTEHFLLSVKKITICNFQLNKNKQIKN